MSNYTLKKYHGTFLRDILTSSSIAIYDLSLQKCYLIPSIIYTSFHFVNIRRKELSTIIILNTQICFSIEYFTILYNRFSQFTKH